jgi:hypothetical protein
MNYSRWRSWDTCRRQYWYSYISKQEWPNDEMSPPGIIGKAVHEGMKYLTDSGDEEVGAQKMDVYLRMPVHESCGPGTDNYRMAHEYYARGMEAHRSLETIDSRTELESWRHFKEYGVRLRARLDRIDKVAENHYRIIDWKTGRYMPDLQTDMQLDIGHVIARITRPQLRSTGIVDAIAWNLRTGETRIRRLTIEDAVITARLMGRLAVRIQREETFEPTAGPHCNICKWQPDCEAAQDAISGRLPDEFYDDEDGLLAEIDDWIDP